MRKCQQKKILELTDTLIEVNSDIQRLISDSSAGEGLTKLLSDCQEFAAAAGNFIESIEGEGTRTVALLEDYCKMLFELNSEPSRTKLKDIKRHTANIKSSVKSELKPNHIEALFLPYKASMSDSLESVWKAAFADWNCDAYIVPIPYYDRAPDGSFGQMHYEGSIYPKDVPITDWNAYDIEVRHPDIIFIHSPYDSGNYVTSIHPNYYSERLKNFTDLLVYIPYFISTEDIPEHLCVCPGTLYSDKVIVQSEPVRQTYIRVFQEFEKRNKLQNHFGRPQDKFVALGSPKFDKIFSTKREDCRLPDQWSKLIKKSDGTEKKVIFYNTTIGALLKGNKQYLQKIRSVLNVFRERSDVVLWWRPHPLNQATYESMRPQLLEEYEKIVSEYQSEGLGIYDDTPDLHRAIAWSDVYYGDGSSVAALYEKTNKPIIYQDCTVKGFAAEVFFFFISMSIHNGKMYSFLYDRNAIIQTDLKSLKVHYYGCVPLKQPNLWRGYHYTYVRGDKMYMIPFLDDQLVICDLISKRFESISLDLKPENCSEGMGKFYNCHLYKDKIFLLPFGYKAIVSYDFKTKEIKHYPISDERVKTKDCSNTWRIFHQYELIGESRLLMPFRLQNVVAEFNMDNGEIKFHTIGEFDFGFNSITKYNDCYWMVALDKLAIIKWHYETGKYTCFTNFPHGCEEGRICFGANEIFRLHNFLYCFPSRSNMVVKINLDNGEISKVSSFDKYCGWESEKKDISLFDGTAFTNSVHGDLIYAMHKGERLVEYNALTEEIRELELSTACFSKDDLERLGNDFLEGLTHGCKNREMPCTIWSNVNEDGTAGEKIYKFIKSVIK